MDTESNTNDNPNDGEDQDGETSKKDFRQLVLERINERRKDPTKSIMSPYPVEYEMLGE